MAKEPTNKLIAITIEGFKSIRKERTLQLSALNILAGSNSSGKSSFIQPLLLLKQTMEASYDPGPLLINGANVKFTSFSQFFSKSNKVKNFGIELQDNFQEKLKFNFYLNNQNELSLKEYSHTSNKEGISTSLKETSTQKYLMNVVKNRGLENLLRIIDDATLHIVRERSFLRIALRNEKQNLLMVRVGNDFFEQISRNMIHVPGLRGNPERSYPKTSIGNNYLGTFDFYVASIIAEWEETGNSKLKELGEQLQKLGLTGKVTAKKLDDTRVELQVGRLPISSNENNDLVSIADVGFGVSQVLPVLVALLVAEPGQVVYIEQPETHLHPKAQRAMAGIFAEAANREATVIVETHSLIFIRAIQTLVAKEEVKKELVKLHWITRDAKGDTSVDTADLDAAGAYGDWPQDFEATEMESEMAYIEAAEAVLFKS